MPGGATASAALARVLAMGEDGGETWLDAYALSPCSAQALAVSLGMSRTSAAHEFAAGLAAPLLSGDAAARAASARALSGGSRLAPGDVVRFRLAPTGGSGAADPAAATAAAGIGDLRILFKDPLMLVVDKPAGLLVHGDGTGASSLTDVVRAHLAEAGRAGAARMAQPVQRLDTQTTGATLFSLTEQFQPAFDALVAAHGERGMRKRYLAVVRGRFPAGRTVSEAPIARDRHDARRMRALAPGARAGAGVRSARTAFELVARKGDLSLVSVELGTGRRHQIRVHLAQMGYAVLGDGLYARGRDARGELMLHAWEQVFDHPVTGARVSVRTPWPERLGALGFSEADVAGA